MNGTGGTTTSLFLSVALIGCGGIEPNGVPEGSTKTPDSTAIRNPNIPAEVSYPIISEEEEYNAFTKKRVVEVQLNTRVSPEVLRQIALEVKSQENKQYERTFMFYYLPEIVPGVEHDPWAISHFNPVLDVQILGLTKEDAESLSNAPIHHPGARIGAWLIDMPPGGHLAVIYEDGGGAKLLDVYPVGDSPAQEMIELPSSRGRRFRPTNSSEIYEVDEWGILRIYNSRGEAFVAAVPLR